MAALLESADHAVLPRGRGQRAAVLQRLRRRAGQRVDVRAIAFDRARGDQDERVGDLGRRRRVLQSDRSGRSDDRVRIVAERRDHADGHSHGPVARHPAAAIAGWRRSRRWRRRGRWRRGRWRRGRRRSGRRDAHRGRSHELGLPVHHQPAPAHAALLGQQLPVSLRRSRRSLDPHQPGPDAQPRRPRHPDHGQGVGSGDDRRLPQRDDDAQHDRGDR